MNTLELALSAALVTCLVTACGDDDPIDIGPNPSDDAGARADMGTTPTDSGTTPTDAGSLADTGTADSGGGGGGFIPPEDTVAVNFSIDDSANRSYTMADGLAWRGTFDWDARTRLLSLDTNSAPPFPLVYDDGPWSRGGHEPNGATAGDNIWGITAFVEVPTRTAVDFEYSAISGSTMGSDGLSIWELQFDTNGTFTVDVGADQAVTVTGLVIPPWGTIDFRILLDSTQMAASFRSSFNPRTDRVEIKSSRWSWQRSIAMVDDGTNGDVAAVDGIYTFQLLPNVGTGTRFPHTGGLRPGDEAQFVLVVGGDEYKGPVNINGMDTNAPLTDGVTAQVSTDNGATWQRVTIGRAGSDDNTTVRAPSN